MTTGPAARQHPAHVYDGIKAASRRLIRVAGGVESAAQVTRVGKTKLGDYENPSTPFFMPIDVVADLEADSGQPLVTRKLALLAGCVLVPVVPVPSPESWAGRLAEIGKECADVFAGAGQALADGTMCAKDAAAVKREVDQAISALAAFRGELDAVMAGAD